MRTFDYRKEAHSLLTHSSIGKIGTAYKFMGERSIIQQTSPGILDTLGETTLLHTVSAGVRNNGVSISFERIKELVSRSATPYSEPEYSVVRYARALSSITNNEYAHVDMMADIRKLNSLLFYDDLNASQNQWRVHNTPYMRGVEKEAGSHTLPPYHDVPELFSKICGEYMAVIREGRIHPLFAMSVFFLDFIAIQPFDRGNFETVRLVLSYLMSWAGFPIMDTVSIEHCLQKHMHQKNRIANSLIGWHNNENDYRPVFDLCMELIGEAHYLFCEWTAVFLKDSMTSKDIVMKIIQLYGGNLTKRMVAEYAPFISESSIEFALYLLKKEGFIEKIGGGRYSEYRYHTPGNPAASHTSD